MPLFKNQNSPSILLSDPCSVSSPISSSVCTLAGLSATKKTALQEMIYICFKYKDETYFPNKGLYEKVLKYLVVKDNNQIPVNNNGNALFTSYTNPTPVNISDKLPELSNSIIQDLEDAVDLNLISVGYISEACSIFSLYYATKTLAEDVGFDIDFTENIDLTPDSLGRYGNSNMFRQNRLSQALAVDFNSKSEIFKKLIDSIFKDNEYGYLKKELLLTPGTSNFKRIAFNLLNPVAKYGFTRLINSSFYKTTDFQYTDFDHEADTGGPSFLTDLFLACMNDGIRKNDETEKILKYNQNDLNNAIASNNKNRLKFIDNIIFNLESQLSQVKEEIINEIATCLFQSLLPKIKTKPQTFFIACGGGSGTHGLFAINNLGVIFFNYKLKYFFKDGFGLVPSSENNLNNRTFIKSKSQTIHMSGFGNDFSTPSRVVLSSIKDGLTFHFNHVEGPPNSINLISINPSNGINKTLIPIPPLPAEQYISYTFNKGEVKDIGNYNKNNFKELRFDDGKTFEFNIEYSSAEQSYNNVLTHDEILLLFNVVTEVTDSIDKPVEVIISLDDLYDNDKFEITKDKINTLFSSEEDKLKVEKIIAFINGGAVINTPDLYGNFIGQQPLSYSAGEAKIIPHEGFDLETYPGINPLPNLYEGVKDDEDDSQHLRYSYAKITADASSIDVEINSWVSPLRSRLDKRFTISDYRTATNYGLFPGGTPPAGFPDNTTLPDITNLNDNYTLAPGSVMANWLYYLYTNPTNTSSTPIRSYNQVLATLRSMGLLEAMCYRIFDISDSDPLIGTKLNQLLTNSSTVSKDRGATVRFLPSNKNLPNTINYAQYNAFKWYRIYYRAKKSDGTFGDTTEFDYDKYRHSF